MYTEGLFLQLIHPNLLTQIQIHLKTTGFLVKFLILKKRKLYAIDVLKFSRYKSKL